MKWKWGILFVALFAIALAQNEDDVDIDEDESADGEESKPTLLEKPIYKKPEVKGKAFFAEPFESEELFKKTWVLSQAKKDDTSEDIAKYDGKWSVDSEESLLEGDLSLVLKSKAKHHAIAAKLNKPYEFKGEPFIVQYEVRFQNGQECGGAYIKLLTKSKIDLKQFKDSTPYTIMFGPDKCGNDNKLHFIFRHKNPKTGEFEEKHAKKPSGDIANVFTDKKTHLFTLVLQPDNGFEIFVDQNLVNSGNLLTDVEPPVNPPKEIDDPNDKKPEDWDERPKIADPDATKPDDWDETEPEYIDDPDSTKPEGWLDDEPELVPDPDAEMPSDWDEDMDGEWEAPMINNPVCESAPGCGEWKPAQQKNPKYKGKWTAPMIENPNYKGKWKPRRIENPDYFEDLNPYKMTTIGAVGLELWSMSDNIIFDNFIITDDKQVADDYAADSWEIKRAQELAGSSGKSVVDAVMDATAERPWLWAVFILVVVLPIVLVIAYCCMSGSKADDISRIKKTDEQTADDEAEEEGEDESAGGGGDADSVKSEDKKKASKSALDADETNEADAEEDTSKTRSSPRKRKGKPRKD